MIAYPALRGLFLLGALAIGAGAHAQGAATGEAAVKALVDAAKAEGEVTFYTAATANVGQRVVDAFTKKYGIKAGFVRLSSTPLLQRYATEAAAGNFAADLVFVAGNAQSYSADGVKKGWAEPISKAGIPAMTSGQYPAKFSRDSSAIISLGPWLIFYNSNKVKGADVPKDWPDLTNPKWKGQVVLADPKTSDAYLDLYSLLYDKYGERLFAGLRAQNMRAYAGGPAAIQAIAAGEGAVALTTIEAAVDGIKKKGAPIGTNTPSYTTGVEMQVFLTDRKRAKHPNAARLLAHYVMTPEGNAVFNDDPGSVSIYDTGRLPSDYRSPPANALERKELIYKLLGL